MRRIGLVISSLLAAGLLFASASASACPAKDTVATAKRIELKSMKKSSRAIFTPAQATKQGQLDDRLIRPHHSYDASAGLIG